MKAERGLRLTGEVPRLPRKWPQTARSANAFLRPTCSLERFEVLDLGLPRLQLEFIDRQLRPLTCTPLLFKTCPPAKLCSHRFLLVLFAAQDPTRTTF